MLACIITTLLLQYKVEHPNVACRQFQMESGRGTSWLATQHNNLFGMRCVTKRTTTQIGCVNGFGRYRDWSDAVLDYRLWQLQSSASGLTERGYVDYLRKVYIKDEKYLEYWYK